MRDADVVIGQLQADLAQRDHDELGALTAQPAEACDEFRIGGIEILVDLVEVVEGAWLIVLDREDECECGHRFLATGQE